MLYIDTGFIFLLHNVQLLKQNNTAFHFAALKGLDNIKGYKFYRPIPGHISYGGTDQH